MLHCLGLLLPFPHWPILSATYGQFVSVREKNIIIFLFLLFRVFGLSSSLLLYSKHFGRFVLRPSSGVSSRIREPTVNFEPIPLFNPWRQIVFIPLNKC